MSAALEFPSNCSTNVYTLNDFGEIAYIVCTVAAPPTNDPAVFATTTENKLARLRKTERQFRENSILAALDVEARQLFTFYKKVDITAQKDQKTLLLKFGHVLRSNTCTIAYKTAARLPDLMKPEQARLYRLFITAIVSSIKLLPTGDTALQHVGPNIYLVEAKPSVSERDPFVKSRKWVLYRIDLQVIPSGHIILSIIKDDRLSFLPFQDSIANPSNVNSSFTAVYLAPIGGIGRVSRSNRYFNERDNDNDNETRHEDDPAFDARMEVWKEILPQWLKEHMNFAIPSLDVQWIEVEVPLEEVGNESDRSQTDVLGSESAVDYISWRTTFWPANLCFLPKSNEPKRQSVMENDQDPMQFVRDWISGTGIAASKTDTGRQNAMEDDDEPLFADEGTFDDPGHFSSFGPPAFSASQMIYPTPPDVGVTHPTPGLSSVDGVAMTPANIPGSSADMATQQDEDMPDFDDVPPASGMSVYYDEDLFEEMPDDNFGQEANGDEPNWDFFDGPGAKRKLSRSGSHSRKEGSTSRDPKQEKVEGKDAKIPREQSLDRPMAAKKEISTISNTSPSMSIAAQAQVHEGQDVSSSGILPVDQKRILQSPTRPAPPLWQHDKAESSVSPANSRRRSSIYDGPKPLPSIPNDNRYGADGDYWFDPSPALSEVNMKSKARAVYQRPPSSPSGSDSSMASSGHSPGRSTVGQVAPKLFRQWTEYDPDSQNGSTQQKEVDKKTIQHDVQQILGLLKPGLVDPPVSLDFRLETPDAPSSSSADLQKMLHIAQVLVDQMTQTSLINHEERPEEGEILGNDHVEMNVDLTGINTSATPSNLFQLTHLKADYNGVRLQGSVSRLRANQICLRRMERPLTASISILNFWDTLNLQPEHGPKDVTALCMHPYPENVRDGSLNLLQRLSDSYTTCALGTHVIGQLAGLTENGLISWHPNSTGERNLLQTATMIGKVLATKSTIKGTVMVYMVSRGESPTSYLEMCIAFYDLFESFTKARRASHGVSDIQLQIIPQSFVASPDTLVIPPQTAYTKLAIEVYNRLPPMDLTGPAAACGSAVVMSRSENSVRLQLTPQYVSPLEKNGPCLHLAYSSSWDKRWLVAVWTDELGRTALSMSYCSHIRPWGKGRPRHEIFREMWEVSQDLMSKVRGPWRLAVVRHGYYEPAELLEWQQVLDSSASSQKRCLLLLLSVQLCPELTVFPPPTHGRGAQTGAHNYYGTPASTPQASMTSPDQIVPATPTSGGSALMNASTPPDLVFDPNNETDLLVVDPSEESWGIVLPYGNNQSRDMTELRPSLITGFLMKRRGPRGEDGYSIIEISLVKSTTLAPNKSSGLSPDESIEDLIRQYRGLVTLGATRGCVDPNRESLPWHIASAMRGARVLEQAM